ncbi:MAG: hypothetical protein WB646_03885 [Steroidobacteraceae bacterium]
MEEPQLFTETADKARNTNRLVSVVAPMLDRKFKAQDSQRSDYVIYDLVIRIRNSQYAVAVTTFGVKYPGKKTHAPRAGPTCGTWPPSKFAHAVYSYASRGTDGLRGASIIGTGTELKATCGNISLQQPGLGAPQRLIVTQRQPKILVHATDTFVVPQVWSHIRVAANHSTEVTAPVIVIMLRRLGELPDAHEFVVGRQMWPAQRALPSTRHMLPAPLREKTMIAAGDDFGTILERDAMRGLDGAPVREYGGSDIAPVPAVASRTINGITEA